MADKRQALMDHMQSTGAQLLRSVVLETMRFEAAEALTIQAPAGAETDAATIAQAMANGTSYGTILGMPEVTRWPGLLDRMRAEAMEERRVRGAVILDFDTRHGDVKILTRDRGTYMLTQSHPSYSRTSAVLTEDQTCAYLQARGTTPAFIDLMTDPEAWSEEKVRGRSWFREHLK
ncbi:hypothetical protein [Nitrospira defluvii]|uniref:Uncharacterized protein n=1 Tax=Nitrospira defluvii TaxID=330214 RepID=A0ABN7M2C0_9BACT|nr:hypothetical protein [Nitrospira defluvii]CAE6779541.1 hypothetical protein NSPZN2_40686 [Nitrospira defluvii]